MSITETAAGFTFTHGSRTYGPYPTRQAAQEGAYDAERGAVPPVEISPLREAAPLSVVTVSRLVCDDYIDKERYGKELGTDYECGNALFYVDDGGYLYLRAFGTEIDLALVERDIADLITLLSNPDVKAARSRYHELTA